MTTIRPGETLFSGLPSLPYSFGDDGAGPIAQRLQLTPSDIDADLSSLFYPGSPPGLTGSPSQPGEASSPFALLALLMLFLSYLFGLGRGGQGDAGGGEAGPLPLPDGLDKPKPILAAIPGDIGHGPSGPAVPFEGLIQGAASKYGVPAALIKAVIAQESNFDPKARNATSGCTGLMQLDPRYFGNGADLTDPALNIDLGTKELRRLLDKFGGDQARALTAYNLGEYADPNSIPAGQSITGVEYARQVLARFA